MKRSKMVKLLTKELFEINREYFVEYDDEKLDEKVADKTLKFLENEGMVCRIEGYDGYYYGWDEEEEKPDPHLKELEELRNALIKLENKNKELQLQILEMSDFTFS